MLVTKKHTSPNSPATTARAMVNKCIRNTITIPKLHFLNKCLFFCLFLAFLFCRRNQIGARRDSDGYLWITGRIDDKLNVSGHLMSTAEIEAVLTEHKKVAESAVVSRPHPIKGECLYCFITPNQNEVFDKTLVNELKKLIRERIGPFAQPDVIQHAPGLPKTRSGKIMRRILRKIAVNDRNVGDTSTLADESIVDQLFANRPE